MNAPISGNTPPPQAMPGPDPKTQVGSLSQVKEGSNGSTQSLQKKVGPSPTPGQEGPQGTISLGQNQDPFSWLEKGLIVEGSSSNGVLSDSIIGSSVFFPTFKNANGAPKISDAILAPRGKRGNDGPLQDSSSQDTSSSSGFNIFKEIELIGELSQQTQQENIFGAIASHKLEEENNQNIIIQNQNKINLNIQAQQAQSGSSGKSAGAVIALDVVTLGLYLMVPSTASNATPASVTTSLTGPDGKTLRSTTVTVTSSGDGSADYTRDTTSASGKNTEVSGSVTENSNNQTTQNGSTINNSEYTKTDTGTTTTADGKTINEEGTSSYDKTTVTYQGSGPGGQGKLDGSSATSGTFHEAKVYSNPNNDHKPQIEKNKNQEHRVSINAGQIETAEAVQNATQILSSLTPHDYDVLTKNISMLAIAALHQ